MFDDLATTLPRTRPLSRSKGAADKLTGSSFIAWVIALAGSAVVTGYAIIASPRGPGRVMPGQRMTHRSSLPARREVAVLATNFMVFRGCFGYCSDPLGHAVRLR
jgi:hypothetical protein